MKPWLNGPAAARALCACTLLLGACAPSADDVRAARTESKGSTDPAASAARQVVQSQDADMVAAVSEGNSSTPVSVSYRVTARPQLNTPVDVSVAITPDKKVKVLSMHLAFKGGDGLDLRSPPHVEIADGGAQEVFHQTVTVVPTQSGVLQLHLTTLVDSTSDSLARSYAMPLVVASATTPRGQPAK